MNVEIVCSSRELFGADRSALRLAEALNSIGLSSTLVLPANRPELGLSAEARAREIPIREERIAIASSHGVEALLALAPSQRRKLNSDITIFNSTAVIASPTAKARRVVIVREWLDPRSLRHRILAIRHRVGAEAIVGVSSGVIAQWRMCVRGPARQHVVHNWLSRSVLDDAAHARCDQPRSGILCVGRFNRWKGQDVLADAYEAAFSDTDDRPSLRFVGSQPGTEFDGRAALLRRRGAAMRWEVLPFSPDPSAYFREAALVVVPSMRPEPFGTVVLEAIAHGCRVIAFSGGGPTDMAKDFPQAVQVVSRVTSELARALTRWWRNGGIPLSPAATLETRQTLEERYSPQAGAAAWQTVIGDLSA